MKKWFHLGARSDRSEGARARVGRPGEHHSDEEILDRIVDRLKNDPLIDAKEIVVEVQSGEVRLSGATLDRRSKALAHEAAASVPGVREIDDRIHVEEMPFSYDPPPGDVYTVAATPVSGIEMANAMIEEEVEQAEEAALRQPRHAKSAYEEDES